MLDFVVHCLRVVPQYNFIVTVIAAAMSIYWGLAKLRQWRLEGIIQKLWDRRNKEIRFKKTRTGTRDAGANEIETGG
jgi:hypothetical protein